MTNATATTPVQVAATLAVESAKTRPVLYTRQGAKVPVALWFGAVAKDRAPKFIGTIAGEQVSGFVRQAKKGVFLDFVGAKMADGNSKPVAKGNLVLNPAGIPKLVLKMETTKAVVWAEVSLGMPHEALLDIGLNTDRQVEKKAAHVAQKAAAEAEAVPA